MSNFVVSFVADDGVALLKIRASEGVLITKLRPCIYTGPPRYNIEAKTQLPS